MRHWNERQRPAVIQLIQDMLVLTFYLISNEILLRAMLDPLLEQFREETESPLRLTFRGLREREETASNSQWPVP